MRGTYRACFWHLHPARVIFNTLNCDKAWFAQLQSPFMSSKPIMHMQVLLKRDGYVGLQSQAAIEAEESEQLLPAIDGSARVSNTIPELANVSQIMAPNSIDAELHAIPLYSQMHDTPAKTSRENVFPEGSSEGNSDNENADPNQTMRQGAQLELQPLSKAKASTSHDEASTYNSSLTCIV